MNIAIALIWLMTVFAATAAARLAYLQGSIDGLREAGEIIGARFPRQSKDGLLTIIAMLAVVPVFSCPWLIAGIAR